MTKQQQVIRGVMRVQEMGGHQFLLCGEHPVARRVKGNPEKGRRDYWESLYPEYTFSEDKDGNITLMSTVDDDVVDDDGVSQMN